MNKLIIFDCDGVLVDSEMIASRIDSIALTSLGYLISPEDCVRKFTGVNTQTLKKIVFDEAGIVLPENLDEVTKQEILDAFEAELMPLLYLEKLASAGIKMCVASSSPRTRVLKSLQIAGQMQHFSEDHIFTSAQVAHGKPAPDLFLYAARQMGCAPKDCIVIEDSIAGIKAAKATRMAVIGFLGGSHARFEWYNSQILDQGAPTAYSSEQLMQMISDFTKGN